MNRHVKNREEEIFTLLNNTEKDCSLYEITENFYNGKTEKFEYILWEDEDEKCVATVVYETRKIQ